MPIAEQTPGKAFRVFADYLTSLLAQTVTQMPLIPVFYTGATEMSLGFRPGGMSTATPIHTKYGTLGLDLSQRCSTFVNDDGKHQLQTVSYRYSIGSLEEGHEPLFRWEYIRHPAGENAHYCRHHFQGPMPTGLELDGTATRFQDIHLPTGWVPIEEVIRFCLHDLGAHARCEPSEWHRVLTASRETFLNEFAARGEA